MSRLQDNKNILKEAFEIWDRTKGGSVDHWLGIMADKIKFKSLADGRADVGFTAKSHTREDMRQYFAGLTTDMEMIHYTVDHYIAEDDMVVAVGTTKWRVKATGKTFETPKCDVVRFANGKIVSFYEYYDTAMVFAAAAPPA